MNGPIIISRASAGPGVRNAAPAKTAPAKTVPAKGRGGRGPGNANAALLDPNIPLSGKNLYNAAVGLTDAQTAGPLAELARQLVQNNANTTAQTKLVGGYYNQLGDLAKQGFGDTQGVASGLNTSLGNIATGENAQLAQSGQNAINALNKYTPPGADNSLGMSGLQQEIARAQGFAAQDEGAFKGFGATLGANASQLAASNLGTTALAGTEGLKGISQAGLLRGEPLQSKVAALDAQRGGLLAANIGKIRQQEVANGIARAAAGTTAAFDQGKLANTAFGITSANARNAASIKAAGSRNAASIAGAAARNNASIGAANERNAANNKARAALKNASVSASRTGRPLSTAQNDKVLGELGKIINAYRTMTSQGVKDKTGKVINAHPTQAQLVAILRSVDPLGGPLVQAAVELIANKGISHATASALHHAGVRGGTYNNLPIKVYGAGNSNAVSGAVGAVTGGVSGLPGALGGVV